MITYIDKTKNLWLPVSSGNINRIVFEGNLSETTNARVRIPREQIEAAGYGNGSMTADASFGAQTDARYTNKDGLWCITIHSGIYAPFSSASGLLPVHTLQGRTVWLSEYETPGLIDYRAWYLEERYFFSDETDTELRLPVCLPFATDTGVTPENKGALRFMSVPLSGIRWFRNPLTYTHNPDRDPGDNTIDAKDIVELLWDARVEAYPEHMFMRLEADEPKVVRGISPGNEYTLYDLYCRVHEAHEGFVHPEVIKIRS